MESDRDECGDVVKRVVKMRAITRYEGWRTKSAARTHSKSLHDNVQSHQILESFS